MKSKVDTGQRAKLRKMQTELKAEDMALAEELPTLDLLDDKGLARRQVVIERRATIILLQGAISRRLRLTKAEDLLASYRNTLESQERVLMRWKSEHARETPPPDLMARIEDYRNRIKALEKGGVEALTAYVEAERKAGQEEQEKERKRL